LDSITEIKNKLTPVFNNNFIEKAYLFGSYAKGNPTESSDVDILIDSRGKIRGIDFFGVLGELTDALNIPVDLIDMSQIIEGSRVQREISDTGVLIYQRT
jgi:predicted nucleotidyltransferase